MIRDMNSPINRKILIIDDNPAIHEDYRKILLATSHSQNSTLAAMESSLFGDPERPEPGKATPFTLDSAMQGKDGLAMVEQALSAGAPYSLAFVDMRMPPGWDGLETIQNLWKVDPSLQVVICTAYSDRSWSEIREILGNSDQLLILKKPFDSIEVLQCAHTLSEKWTLGKLARTRIDSLEELIQARTIEVVTAHRIKSEFLANMSHELLTPMNGILGFTQALQATPINRDQRELCTLLEECGQRLLGLIQDVLTFNELEAEKAMLSHEVLNIRDLFLEVRQALALEARRKNLMFSTEVEDRVPIRLNGDRGKLKQVLAKLASNAVKFTESGRVTLRTRLVSAPSKTPQILCEVIDTGVGITPETLRVLEQNFAQAEGAANRKQGGIGAGLTLTRRLLELMGSRLQVTSQAGKGSNFFFALDLGIPTDRQATPLACSEQGLDI